MSRTDHPLRLTLLAVSVGIAMCACHRSALSARVVGGETPAVDAQQDRVGFAIGRTSDATPRGDWAALKTATSSHAPAPLHESEHGAPRASVVPAPDANVGASRRAPPDAARDDDCGRDQMTPTLGERGLPGSTQLPAAPASVAARPTPGGPRPLWLAWLLVPAVGLIAWRRRRKQRQRALPRPPAVVSWMPTQAALPGADPAPMPSLDWIGVDHAVPVSSPPLDVAPPLLRVEHDLGAWPGQRAGAIQAPSRERFRHMPQPPCTLLAAPATLLQLPPPVAAEEPPVLQHADRSQAEPDVELPAADPDHEKGAHWARVGQRWWQQAQDGGDDAAEALNHATEAFERAMALEPARADVLGAMLSRCHLAQARLTHGQARIAHLDAALLDQPQSPQDSAQPLGVRMHRAEILYERALAVPSQERSTWLDMAGACLVDLPAADHCDPLVDQARRLAVRIQMAHAETAAGRRGDALFAATIGEASAGVERATGVDRDAWLALLVTCQERHLQRLNGAARSAAAQRARAMTGPWLRHAVTLEPLLAWLRLLAVWAEGTQGGVASDRHAEVEEMLDRAEQLSPDVRAGVDFARACHLRLRARSEAGGKRLQLLREALRLLGDIRDPQIPASLIALEAAQLHLAAARAIAGTEGVADLQRAAQFADTAAHSAAHRADALICAVEARLQLTQRSSPSDAARDALLQRAGQLRALDIHPALTLPLLAEVELSCGHYARACAACVEAWDAGAAASAILPVWRNALSHWSHALGADDASAWQDAHKRLRSAATSHS